MIRKIIHIDEAACTGCGLCVSACHEGAIELVNGKARLAHEHYCDGLGDCLPACPAGAITFTEREAPAYDEAAVLAAKAKKAAAAAQPAAPSGGCPGMAARRIQPADPSAVPAESGSCLMQWPVQIKLLPTRAPYYQGAHLLIAADCTAYAYAAFHDHFMRGRITLVGCPKLDAVDYSEKLSAIFRDNAIASITVVRMEVPCCGGMQSAVLRALQASGKALPCTVITLSSDGRILDRSAF